MGEFDFFIFLKNTDHILLLQWVGVFFGALQVWYAKENKPINYLFGIVSILINIYVLYFSKLYAEIFLSLYYLTMSIYGWWYWMHGRHRKKQTETPISYSTRKEWMIAVSIVAGSFFAFYFGLIYLTDSTVPLWDSLVTAFAWAGMWLLAKRKMENWLFLNMSNIIAIPLLYYKNLPVFSGFTIFLFGMGVWGYINWFRLIRSNKNDTD